MIAIAPIDRVASTSSVLGMAEGAASLSQAQPTFSNSLLVAARALPQGNESTSERMKGPSPQKNIPRVLHSDGPASKSGAGSTTKHQQAAVPAGRNASPLGACASSAPIQTPLQLVPPVAAQGLSAGMSVLGGLDREEPVTGLSSDSPAAEHSGLDNACDPATAHASGSQTPLESEAIGRLDRATQDDRSASLAAKSSDDCIEAVAESSSVMPEQGAAYSQTMVDVDTAAPSGFSGFISNRLPGVAAVPVGGSKAWAATTASVASGVRQHGATTPLDASSMAASDGSMTSGDQGSAPLSPLIQDIAPALTSVVDHSMVSAGHVQHGAITSLEQADVIGARDAGPATSATDASRGLSAAPPASPVIHLARMIQEMGSSEMRLGMRSIEFGNISINTRATKDQIAAEISVDHGDLAKAIAANLPEMQNRLGVNQGIAIRIDVMQEGMHRGEAGSTGAHSSSPEQSPGGRQQNSDGTKSHSINMHAGGKLQPVSAALIHNEGKTVSRLDIRI